MTEFQQMVSNLAKPGQKIINDLTPNKAHMLHMAIGISGEVGELAIPIYKTIYDKQKVDIDNIKEELGDIWFYLEGLEQSLDLISERSGCEVEINIEKEILSLSVSASHVLDIVKKHAIYGKELDISNLRDYIGYIKLDLFNMTSYFGLKTEDIIQANITKLNKRYSTGSYHNLDAQIRADKIKGK